MPGVLGNTLFQGLFGFSNILFTTDCARNQVNQPLCIAVELSWFICEIYAICSGTFYPFSALNFGTE